MRAANRVGDAEMNRTMSLAWHTAALGRVRSLPSLTKLLHRDDRPLAEQFRQTRADYAEILAEMGVTDA